ncbi:MBG domain-containing protein [Mucilaginibacter flavus]|uniref:MBG domain-containing protein n=1 Tax=Mucilaginibacter flavus TaxID=931504 RepID=UPI0025B60215|nr:MBG domain-containing protein [Mucilaginibacter flavus]MDN3583363.1 MBG domain-containing protein [Mucilaginibacter flavus]
MKKTLKKGLYIAVVIFLFLGAAFPAFASLTGTNLESGGLYTALAKDANNNLYVTRVQAGTGGATYEVVKYINGTGAPVSIYNGLTHELGDYPWGLAVTSTGDVYVSTDFTSNAGAIIKLTFSGGVYTSSTFQTGNYYSALAIDASNNLYTAEYDAGNGTYAVVKYAAGSSAGSAGTRLYDNLKSAAGYAYPTGLAIAANGDIYVADAFSNDPSITDGGHVYKLTAASAYAVSTVSTGKYATALAVDASGNLYSSENSGAGYQLVKYTNGAGTGAAVYSPLHSNGIYYPWGIAIFNAGNIFVADGDDGVNGGAVIHLTGPPTVQASNLTFSNISGFGATAGWTNGNGASRAVFVSNSSTGSPALVDGTTYVANAAFGSGNQIGSSGWYCVYNGTGTSVAITNLSAGNTYRVMTVEYSGAGSGASYLTTAGTNNPVNFNTLTLVDVNVTSTDNTTTYTPGTTHTYVIKVTNYGPNNVTGETVASILPAGSTWAAAFTGGATGTASGSSSINELVNIPFNGAVTYTATVPIPSSQTGQFINTTTLTAPAGVTDVNPANDQANDVDTQNSIADLSITNTDGVPTYISGTTHNYTVVVTNNGPSDVTGAIVTNPLPAGSTWAATFTGGATGIASGTVSINVTDDIPSGGTATYNITAPIPGTQIGNYTSTATVTTPAAVTDPTPGNNTASDVDTPVSNITSAGSLTALTTTFGTASASTTFNVSGSNLTAGILVTPPAGFEVSANNATFTGTVTIGAAGNISSTPVYVRLAAATAPGNYSGNIVLSSPTATSVNVATVSSTVTLNPAKIFYSGTLTALTTTFGTASSPTTFSVSGTDLTAGILVTPPVGFEVSADNATFTSTVTIGAAGTVSSTPVYVRLAATTPVGNYSGNIVLSSPTATNVDVATALSTVNALNIAVSSIKRTASSPVNSNSITYTVTFGANITGLTTSNFSLTTTGVAGASITSLTGSGAVYTVTVNTGTGDGTIVLNLANSTGTTPGISTALPFAGELYAIDKTPPIATSLIYASNNTNSGLAKVGDVVTLLFGSNEAIQTPTVTIAGHAITAASLGGNNYSASYTMTAGDTEGRIPFALSFSDLAGNPAINGLSYNDVAAGDLITFDKTPPTVSTLTFTSNNSNNAEAKVGDIVTLNFTTSEAIQTPAVVIAGHTIAATNPSSDHINWSAAYTMTAGDTEGTIPFSLLFADLAGNNSASYTQSTTNKIVVFDKTSPAVTAINLHTPATSPTNATTLVYRVNFSEPVSGGNTGAFSLTSTGTATGTIFQTATAGSNGLDVTVNNVSGVGTLRLDFKAAPTGISDQAGNLTTTGFTNGQVYTIIQVPTATTSSSTFVSTTSETVTGSANDNGSATTVSFTYGTTADLSGTTTTIQATTGGTISAGGGQTGASLTLTNLIPSTTYYYQLTATNNAGTGKGLILSFNSTAPASAPAVTTLGPPTAITFAGATIAGFVNSNGAATSVVFNYGLSATLSGATTATATTNGSLAAGASGNASLSLTGLVPLTTYYYQVKASNSLGTTPGSILSFTTLASSNSNLSSLSINQGTLSPVFSPGQTSYAATVSNAISTLSVTPVTGDSHATVSINGSAASSGLATNVNLAVGANTITTVVTAQDGSTTSTYTVIVTRNKAPQTITFAALPSKTYGNADFAPGATSTNSTIPVTYNSDNTAVATIVGGNIHIIGAGTANITASQAGNANFNAATDVPQQLIVSKAPVTVTADSKNKAFGDPDPALTYQVTSGALVGTDVFTGTLSRTTGENVGSYPILQNSLALNANYALTYVGANLTIGQVSQTITFAALPSKTYGDVDFAPGATSNNNTIPITYSSDNTAVATIIGGMIHIVGAGTANITALQAGNASFIAAADVSRQLNVGKVAITVIADAKSKVFNTPDPALTYQITNGALVGTDVFTGGLSRTAGESVGAYPILQNTLALNNNYTLTYIGANLSIGQSTQAITFAALPLKTYGDADFTPGATSNNNTIPITYSSDNTAVATIVSGQIHIVGAGTANITASQAGNASYAATVNVVRQLTVGKVAITVTAGSKNKVFGAADPALTYSVTSGALIGADAFTGTLNRAVGENVGVYPISQNTLALSGNYALTYVGANLTIGQSTQAITFAALPSKTYGDADFAPGATSTNNTIPVTYSSNNTAVATIVNGNIHIVGAGTANITASQAGNTNYAAATDVTTLLTVGKVAITVTADSKSKAFGAADPAFTYSITSGALISGDAFTGTLNRSPGENVGIYPILQNTLALSGNYTLTYAGANLTIGQVSQSITFAALPSKTYGDVDFASGAVSTNNTIPVTYSSDNTAVASIVNGKIHIIGAGTVNITASQAGNATFIAAADVTQQLTVGKAVIAVTANAQSKTYGDADPALTYNITAGALVGADAFTGSLNRAAGETVGAYAINRGTLALNTNYALTYTGANLTVTTKAITVTANAQSKGYGDADPSLTYNVTNGALVGTDSFTGALSRNAGESVGNYPIAKGTLALNSNYLLTYIGANLTITAKAVTITADARTKIYGAADPALTYSITNGSLANGDTFTGALTRVAGESVGTYAINKGTLALNSNYTLTYAGASFTISKASLSITADNLSKTYGQPNPVFTLSYSGFVNGDTKASLNTPATATSTATTSSAAGSYAITPTGAIDANYIITYTNGKLTVNPATLTVTAGNATRIYKTANPVFTVTYSGFVNGDTQASLTTPATATTLATTTSVVGTYPITPAGAVSGNYGLNYINGALTITAATRALTFNPLTAKTYGTADFDPGAIASSGETIIYSSSNTAVATIVNGKIHITGAGIATISATLPVNTNYSNTPLVSRAFVVNKAHQTIDFAALPDQTKGSTFDLSGVTSSSGLPVTFTSADEGVASISGATLNALHIGTTTITATQGGNNNYFAATSVVQTVTVNDAAGDEILVHQAVSPNGDGINDYLFIEGIKNYPENEVLLFNRNGVLVYQTFNYNNSSNLFDGHSSVTGVLQQAGTYFYKVEFVVNGEKKHKTGFFVLKYQ